MTATKEISNIKIEGLNAGSRVWVYQSARFLSDQEVESMKQDLEVFVTNWAAHGTNLRADFGVYYNLFVCLFVDETAQGATGCSIDSSVHFIQSLEKKYGLDLMNRTNIAYVEEGQIMLTDMNNFSSLAQAGKVDQDTPVFNNLVQNLGDFSTKWLGPVAESWHARLI